MLEKVLIHPKSLCKCTPPRDLDWMQGASQEELRWVRNGSYQVKREPFAKSFE